MYIPPVQNSVFVPTLDFNAIRDSPPKSSHVAHPLFLRVGKAYKKNAPIFTMHFRIFYGMNPAAWSKVI